MLLDDYKKRCQVSIMLKHNVMINALINTAGLHIAVYFHLLTLALSFA